MGSPNEGPRKKALRIPRIYLPEAEPDREVPLPPETAHRLTRVLRLEPGHPVVAFTGRGGEYTAELAGSPRHPTVVLDGFQEVERESPLETILWTGLSKGEKLDWIVQKATELGVAEIRPVRTERSVRRLDPGKADKSRRRWVRIAASACEQCGRNRLPRIHEVTDLDPALDRGVSKGLVMATTGEAPPADLGSDPVHILVGPEGGLAGRELEKAVASGFSPAAFGPRTLRTETAALAALAWAQTVAGDFPGPPS